MNLLDQAERERHIPEALQSEIHRRDVPHNFGGIPGSPSVILYGFVLKNIAEACLGSLNLGTEKSLLSNVHRKKHVRVRKVHG